MKVLVGGNFDLVDGVRRLGIARLNADGSLDAGFDPKKVTYNGGSADLRGVVSVVQDDGKVLIGGYFWASNNGVNRYGIARLNSDGSLDTGFTASPDYSVQAIALQDDGKVLIGGSFNFVNGVSRNGIARLNPDGSLDAGFDPGSGSFYNPDFIILQLDGKILIRGTRLNGDSPLKFVPFAGPVNVSLRVTLTVQPSRNYIFQASTNLDDWIPLGTNSASGYTLDFEDTNAASFTQRFYRAVAP